jgi:hypothetical protein
LVLWGWFVGWGWIVVRDPQRDLDADGVEVHLHRVRLPGSGQARAANALCSVKRRWDFVGGTQF